MTAHQSPSNAQAIANSPAASQAPAEYQAWRQGRWEEIAGPNGKGKVVASGKVIGSDVRTIAGIPGQWCCNEAGVLTVTGLELQPNGKRR